MSQIPIGWLMKKEGFVYPFKNRLMMIDGIPNRPLYFYQKDIIGLDAVVFMAFSIFFIIFHHIHAYFMGILFCSDIPSLGQEIVAEMKKGSGSIGDPNSWSW